MELCSGVLLVRILGLEAVVKHWNNTSIMLYNYLLYTSIAGKSVREFHFVIKLLDLRAFTFS